MPQQPQRRLKLVDLILIVAATAPGLAYFVAIVPALTPWYFKTQLPGLLVFPQRYWTVSDVLTRPVEILGLAIPLLAPWSIMVLILRFTSPRPTIRRAARQPGVVACFATAVGFAWTGLGMLWAWLASIWWPMRAGRNSDPLIWMRAFFIDEVFPAAGIAVAIAWLTLLLSRQWRRSADWIDSFGRLLGIVWILIGFAWTARRFLYVAMH